MIVVMEVLRAAMQAIRGTDLQLDIRNGSTSRVTVCAVQGEGVRVVWERGPLS